VRRLNNLVTELAAGQQLASGEGIRLQNPRKGWVYLACADGGAATIDGADVYMRTYAGRDEAMAYLPEGEFVVGAPSGVEDIVVRTVPELMYCKYGYDPYIPEYGPYDQPYLEAHVLPHVNTIIGAGGDAERPFAEQWTSRGGRWIVERSLPTDRDEEHDVDDVVRTWTDTPGLTDPLYDGIFIDEFFCGDHAGYPAFAEALRRIAADKRFDGKDIYPYVGSHFPDRDDWGAYDPDDDSRSSLHLWRTLLDLGYPMAWERYMQERHTEEIAREHIGWKVGECMRAWRRALPEAPRHMVQVMGYMDFGFQLDIHPEADMRAFRDMQFHYIANDDAFDGLRGVTGWTSGYADDETIRWTAKLYRHYGIEGNTEPLSDQYGFSYRNDHIANGDFTHHWEGWDVPFDIERNCAVKTHDGHSILQGRWNHTSCGNAFLVLTRSADRPNAVSQPMRKLVPGRLYSVKAIVGSYDALLAGQSEEIRHGVNIEIEGGDVVPEKTFVSVRPNHPTTEAAGFDGENRYWLNYHRTVFRATASTGKLTISDWAGGRPDDPVGVRPDGPVGARNAVNFVQVQEYLEE